MTSSLPRREGLIGSCTAQSHSIVVKSSVGICYDERTAVDLLLAIGEGVSSFADP
jgi:hypothetical protein